MSPILEFYYVETIAGFIRSSNEFVLQIHTDCYCKRYLCMYKEKVSSTYTYMN